MHGGEKMKQFDDPQIQQYFETLPAFIQDSIMQSGIIITSVEQLKSCAQHITEKKSMQ